MMMTRGALFFLLLTLGSCKSQPRWDGGKITKEGVYENEDFKIIAIDEDNSLVYFMLDSKGDTLIRSDKKFSMFHRWALQLDKDQTLWVLSSDIGHGCWKKDPITHKYIKRDFFGPILKDSIPVEVYSTLKLFHPYSSED
jgi:hypothetical protein